jgi:hypothetical protein
MPFRRRRPLLRAAAVGGTAYAVGKHRGRGAEAEDEQEQYDDQVPQQAPAPASESDRLDSIKQLAELHDSGALSDEEFAREKDRLLNP